MSENSVVKVSLALGNRIKELRQKHNLSQVTLASCCGVSHAFIGLIER